VDGNAGLAEVDGCGRHTRELNTIMVFRASIALIGKLHVSVADRSKAVVFHEIDEEFGNVLFRHCMIQLHLRSTRVISWCVNSFGYEPLIEDYIVEIAV